MGRPTTSATNSVQLETYRCKPVVRYRWQRIAKCRALAALAQELLEEEEALLEKERRHLQAESLAVEHLLTEFAAAEGERLVAVDRV